MMKQPEEEWRQRQVERNRYVLRFHENRYAKYAEPVPVNRFVNRFLTVQAEPVRIGSTHWVMTDMAGSTSRPVSHCSSFAVGHGPMVQHPDRLLCTLRHTACHC